jgi:hypothetical protein
LVGVARQAARDHEARASSAVFGGKIMSSPVDPGKSLISLLIPTGGTE